MPDIRRNPLTGLWVVVATERLQRPHELRTQEVVEDAGQCPFCPGREHATPQEVLRFGGNDWTQRVVVNKYPALRVEQSQRKWGVGPYDAVDGLGAHEVVIETRAHSQSEAEFRAEGQRMVLKAWQDRASDLARDTRFEYCAIFRNHGAMAGATLAHPHSQIIAMPFVPVQVRWELQRSERHWNVRERSLLQDIVDTERASGDRIVFENDHVVVFCPFASAHAFETWIVPKNCGSHFERAFPRTRDEVADALTQTLLLHRRALGDAPYNLTLQSAPMRLRVPYYQWHIRILPSLSRVAGFEWGTGTRINHTDPDAAAAYMRDILSEEE